MPTSTKLQQDFAFCAGAMEELSKSFKFFSSILVFSVIVREISNSEVPRPRGVSLSRAALYSPGEIFLCFDNSKKILFSQVNDDYCDCPDASDEPGTSACPHGTFHCANAGHRPLNIASSRVNDGVCDCCDGTDEYASKRANCPNTCLQLGRHAKEKAQKLAELIKVGKLLKLELSQKGVQMKQEKKEKLVELQKNKEEAEKVKSEKQALKNEAEALENQALDYYRKLEEEENRKKAEAEAAKNREEAAETFNQFDSNQDGVVELAELKTRQTFDKDKDGEVSDEEARYFLNNEDAVDVEKFISDAWPNVKPYLMMDAGMFKPPSSETNNQDGSVEEEKQGQENEEVEEEEDEDTTADDQDADEDEEEEEHPYAHAGEPAGPLDYDEDTQDLVERANKARDGFAKAEKAVRDIDSEIKGIQEYLEKDFGPDEEFSSLQDQCFSYDDHEYTYKLCPFEKAVQMPKSGGAETRLGTWGKWTGPEDNVYEAMMYEKGQNCWNGPQRSSEVRISCGTQSQVTSVSEPNRCEYLFEFETPAACRELPVDNDDDLHDEL